MAKAAQQLIREARQATEAIAVGPFTPIVLERYELIGGESGVRLGFPVETNTGRAGIAWSHIPHCANVQPT